MRNSSTALETSSGSRTTWLTTPANPAPYSVARPVAISSRNPEPALTSAALEILLGDTGPGEHLTLDGYQELNVHPASFLGLAGGLTGAMNSLYNLNIG
jgi:hypothetical protein